MGKEQINQRQGGNNLQSRKIIKKFPFKVLKSKVDDNSDEEIRQWKPQKISQIKQKQKKVIQNEKKNIAMTFLSNLPKPQAKIQQKPTFLSEKIIIAPPIKNIKKQEPTAEQIKWDIQDKSFIKNQFVNEPKNIEHKLEEEDEENVTIDRIKWLNEDPKLTKQIDLTKVIDKNWKANVDKASFQNDIWSTSFLKGKGQLSNFVKQAIDKFDEDEITINRRAMIKQKMRSRYGW